MFMNAVDPTLEGFLARLADTGSTSQAWQEALCYFKQMGIAGLVCLTCRGLSVLSAQREELGILAEADPSVVQACTDPDEGTTDPVMTHLATAMHPLAFTPHVTEAGPPDTQNHVLSVAGRAGYRGLIAVPVRCCSSPCTSGLILLSHQETNQFEALFKQNSLNLAFAAVQVHMRVWQFSHHQDAPNPTLTRREREVLMLSARGMTTREVGDALGISISGVNFHISNAGKKLGANNRTHATSLAIAGGMISI